MHITKPIPDMKRCAQFFLVSSFLYSLSTITYADEGHDHHTMEMNHSAQSAMQMDASVPIDHSQHQHSMPISQSNSESQSTAHDHSSEHGGQIYQSTQLDTQWLLEKEGQGTLKSKLKSWVGSDENKLFVIADYAKAESEKSDQSVAALYSRNISDFWDVQTGINYQYNTTHHTDKERYEAVLGIHGMAQYFFETDAHFYIGQDQQWRFVLETERDLLLTQKLIMQPYLELEWVLQDQSRYAAKTGLSDAEIGIKTRYEVVKNRVMPFIDVGYGYSKGQKATDWQNATASETGWHYGVGLSLKF